MSTAEQEALADAVVEAGINAALAEIAKKQSSSSSSVPEHGTSQVKSQRPINGSPDWC